ncbi:hypothetical protein [Nocardioides bruguierae]|uniref:Transcriptional regulator, AbiEi antitoxin, Type IV TA system n=1 Tax=Nocardioides bruguierae TaxID=2945102 RepID=A0A9X2DC58_9ACTN|nr:hypothetical protein [Nocardioides bruguierae]MCM0622682.1 hypothetical protein [Nocardioides bruguierae]
MDDEDLRVCLRALQRQCGVVTLQQLRDHAPAQRPLARADVARWERRRLLRRVHRAVWVDHTGPLTDEQTCWAAVLAVGPAALHLESATDLSHRPVEVAVDESRRVRPPVGVRLHRVRGLAQRVRAAASPPRVRVEEVVLGLVEHADAGTAVVRLLSDAVGDRSSTPARLRHAARRRRRLRHRRLVLAVLDDVEAGACSVLERAYLHRVERAHGLPTGSRQDPRPGGRGLQDVTYGGGLVSVELDGRLGYAGWVAGARDARRDLEDAAAGQHRLRLRYAQVLDDPCRTAGLLGRVLAHHGWRGAVRACGPSCPAASA